MPVFHKTIICREFVKRKLEAITRDPEHCMTEIEILRVGVKNWDDD